MTKVKVFRKNGNIIGYKATGHSGYSEQGSDIVCASISTALQIPLISIQELLKLNVEFKIDENGYLEVNLSDLKEDELKKLSLTLETMVLFVKELSKQYPKNIKLVEKEEK